MRKHLASSSLVSRLGFVVMSLLWSLSVNCLTTIYLRTSRFWQILIIAAVDNLGKSVLNGVFIVSHLRCWSRINQRVGNSNCARSSLYNYEGGFILFFIVFFVFFLTWLLMAMSGTQLYSSVSSFFPIWLFSRVTELFYWAALWAFLVQYGSSESARRTLNANLRKLKDREKERSRRAYLFHQRMPWWNFNWLWGRSA
jgi:hypothetical protein